MLAWEVFPDDGADVLVLDEYNLTLSYKVSELGSVDLTCLLVEHSDDPDGD